MEHERVKNSWKSCLTFQTSTAKEKTLELDFLESWIRTYFFETPNESLFFLNPKSETSFYESPVRTCFLESWLRTYFCRILSENLFFKDLEWQPMLFLKSRVRDYFLRILIKRLFFRIFDFETINFMKLLVLIHQIKSKILSSNAKFCIYQFPYGLRRELFLRF